jgi:hypothetical protein
MINIILFPFINIVKCNFKIGIPFTTLQLGPIKSPTESKTMNSFEGLNITPPYVTNLQGNNAFYTTLRLRFNMKKHMGYYGEDV